jgi:DNA-binding IclR family transcriptional regulator
MVLDGNAVRSVDRAAALLLALGESQGEAGVTELARRLGLHKSTASRLLATLQKRGLVEQDGATGNYRLGLVVIRLAERAERTLDLRGIALPELERLARLTHETTGLGILDGDSMLAVAQVDGPNLIAVGDWTGRATPLHCVASGKVLMAALAEREVLRIVRRGLLSHTERTITELEPLLEELARIRRRGYATAIGSTSSSSTRSRRRSTMRQRIAGRHLGTRLPPDARHPELAPSARGGRHLGRLAGCRLSPDRHASCAAMPDFAKSPWSDIADFVRHEVVPVLLIVIAAYVALRLARLFVHGVVKTLLDREATEGPGAERSSSRSGWTRSTRWRQRASS